MSKIYTTAVVGGGAAGVMATMRSVLNNDDTLFFPGTGKHKKKSRGFWVKKVENMPGHLKYSRGIEEPNNENLHWLCESPFYSKFHWMKNRGVEKIQKNGDELFEITDNKGSTYLAEHVILCTGVMDIQPKVGDEIDPIFPYANVQLVDYCIRCDGHHAINTDLTVIGNFDETVWIGFILHERYQPKSVTILYNGEPYPLSEKEQMLVELYNIKILNQKIVGVKGKAKENILEGYELEDGTFVKSDFSFVSMGMMVYNQLAKDLGCELDERGFVKTDAKGLTNIPKLYVAGDLRANTKKQIYTSWDTAVDAADDINTKHRRATREKLLQENS